MELAKLPMIIGAPRTDQLREGQSRKRLGQGLGHDAYRRNRCHGAGENKGRHDAGLIVPRIDLERPQHGVVKVHGGSWR